MSANKSKVAVIESVRVEDQSTCLEVFGELHEFGGIGKTFSLSQLKQTA